MHSARFQTLRDLVPIDIDEERIDVLARRGAVVHLVRVLVHIHHEDGPRMRGVRRMICKPIVLEHFEMFVIPEDYPPGTAPEPMTDLSKLAFPLIEGAERASY